MKSRPTAFDRDLTEILARLPIGEHTVIVEKWPAFKACMKLEGMTTIHDFPSLNLQMHIIPNLGEK